MVGKNTCAARLMSRVANARFGNSWRFRGVEPGKTGVWGSETTGGVVKSGKLKLENWV